MDAITIRELKHVTTLVFEQTNGETSRLLRLLADYLDASSGTLQSVTFLNDLDGDGYRERIVAHVEAPYPSTIDWRA
jgi:hypothetical protein